MVHEAPRKGGEIQLEIRGDSKTVVEWINGKARQRSTGEAVGNVKKNSCGNGGAGPST